jgi:hypothetical protein
MTEWIPGMFYDVGGAAALYWPDQHPENREPAEQRWIVFTPWGGMEVITGRPPREDAPIEREMGMAPFLVQEEGRYVFGSKNQLMAMTARLHSRLDDARKRYIDEAREIVAAELDIEFPKPKEGT